MLLVLEDLRLPTWNSLYSGNMHWSKRRNVAAAIHELVIAAVRNKYGFVDPFDKRVHIIVTEYFKSRPHDCCNIPAKLPIDGLRHAGVIIDDTREYVASVTTISEIDRNNPRVEILITPEE